MKSTNIEGDDGTRFISLRTKFVAFLSLIIIASCVGLTWYFVQNKTAAMTEQLTSLGNILVKNLAYNSRFGLITGDTSFLQQLLDGTMEVEEVVYAVMTTEPDGRPLVSRTKGMLKSRKTLDRSRGIPLYPDAAIAIKLFGSSDNAPVVTAFTTADGDTIYDFAVTIRRRPQPEPFSDPFSLAPPDRQQTSDAAIEGPGKVYGLVQIGLSQAQKKQALNDVIRDLVVLAFIIIAVGIISTILLSGRIVTPLRSLMMVARRIASGDLQTLITPTTADEVGQLTRVFNSMTQSLKERDDAISTNLETIRRQVSQLTTLNQASTAITSTLDLDRLLSSVLQLLMDNLGFAHMTLVLYDSDRGIAYVGRAAGVSQEVEEAARTLEIPVRDDDGTDAELLLRGKPILVLDIETVAGRMYPPVLALIRQIGVISFVGVPLRSQQRILGYLAADRGAQPCRQEDLDLLLTVASHVGVAIDNARAYLELELLTQTLEKRVQERTQELQTVNDKLEEQDERKSKFVSVASHELRTPMTSIRGFVENMLDGLTGELTERQRYYLSRVKHNVERLTRLINQLLIWSRIDAGRVELVLGPVSIAELVHDVVSSFQTLAESSQVVLQTQVPEGLPTLRIDRDKIEQVLWNLIGNALKFTPPGGRVGVEACAQENNCIEVCVADTGCGIAPHETIKLFDEFSKIESTLPGSQGAQLGLFITKSYVKLHGGQISVDSNLGLGSRFCFTLPIDLP
ncbi:MAG: ATP-binding protein [Nitrospiraceae bacterium]